MRRSSSGVFLGGERRASPAEFCLVFFLGFSDLTMYGSSNFLCLAKQGLFCSRVNVGPKTATTITATARTASGNH